MPVPFPVSIATFAMSGGPKKTIFIPQAIQMMNKQLEVMINHTIIKEIEAMIAQQDGEMEDVLVEEVLGTYEIKNNQRNVLSLSLSNYTYHARAAHGMTIIKSLTFDLRKGEKCTLKDLFKPGSDYVKRLSALIQEQIKVRDIQLLNGFTAIRPDQDFYLADKSIVIYFQLYELTAYVYGLPMFPISIYDLQDIIDENGPLGRLAQNN